MTDDTEVSRAYRAALQDEPPTAVDDAIRAAARRAVQARPQPLRKTWLPRWQTPIAAAAMVMLTFYLVIIAGGKQPELLTQVPLEVATLAQNTFDVQKEKNASVPAQEQIMSKSNRVVVQPAARLKSSAKLEEQNTVALPRPSNAAPPPMTIADDASQRAEKSVQFYANKPPRIAEATQSQDSSVISLMPFEGKSLKGDSAALPQPSIRALANDDYQPAMAAAQTAEPPELWLKRIEELRKQDKLKEAKEEIVLFRKHHPNIVLPKEWAGLIAQ